MDARLTDLLDLHDNVARRVRNLETGVHPLRAEVDFYDSIPPTPFPRATGGSAALSSGGIDLTQRPQYQKRAGIGSLIGALFELNPQAADLQDDDGALWNTLPETMWPTLTHTFLAWAERTPYVARVQVNSTGQVRLFGGALPAAATLVYLDGLTWPVT